METKNILKINVTFLNLKIMLTLFGMIYYTWGIFAATGVLNMGIALGGLAIIAAILIK